VTLGLIVQIILVTKKKGRSDAFRLLCVSCALRKLMTMQGFLIGVGFWSVAYVWRAYMRVVISNAADRTGASN